MNTMQKPVLFVNWRIFCYIITNSAETFTCVLVMLECTRFWFFFLLEWKSSRYFCFCLGPTIISLTRWFVRIVLHIFFTGTSFESVLVSIVHSLRISCINLCDLLTRFFQYFCSAIFDWLRYRSVKLQLVNW